LPAVCDELVRFVTDTPKRTAPMIVLHQIIELRLLTTADQSKMQRRWIWICVPDMPEHGHRVTETRGKVQNRTLFLDTDYVIGENELALGTNYMNCGIEVR